MPIGLLVFAGATGGGPIASGASWLRSRAVATPVVTVEQSAVGRPIPAGFLGLSTEYRGVEWYAGTEPDALDPVFLQLVRNLAPAQRPVLRIGGDSTDWTWWPVRDMRRPPGATYALTARWLAVTRAVARALDARLILGINLAADSRKVAGIEARVLIRGIGRQSLEALELGNEPELYGSFSWYQTPAGRNVPARPARNWTFSSYLHDFSRIARALPRATIAGPAAGSSLWMRRLSLFIRAEPRVRLLTVHRYALKRCGSSSNSTVSELLSNAASQGLARAVVRDTQTAHAHGLEVRSDEINSIACGGQLGVSNTFAAALWALDTLFAMARVGIDGVNFHTEPGSFNELFSVTDVPGWEANVHPEYYGLMLFAQAAPKGARLLRIVGAARSRVHIWATRAADGELHVVLINKDPRRSHNITLQIPSAPGPATIETLRAPSAYATTGVTLGGQTFGTETTTGLLAGAPTLTTLTPAFPHTYTIHVSAASATLVTLSSHDR
jgi:hypothetical protein